jgi:hypothetical protein
MHPWAGKTCEATQLADYGSGSGSLGSYAVSNSSLTKRNKFVEMGMNRFPAAIPQPCDIRFDPLCDSWAKSEATAADDLSRI